MPLNLPIAKLLDSNGSSNSTPRQGQVDMGTVYEQHNWGTWIGKVVCCCGVLHMLIENIGKNYQKPTFMVWIDPHYPSKSRLNIASELRLALMVTIEILYTTRV